MEKIAEHRRAAKSTAGDRGWFIEVTMKGEMRMAQVARMGNIGDEFAG